MKLAISNIAWPPELLPDALSIMADTGVLGLEIAPGLAFYDADDPLSPSAGQIDQFRHKIAEFGIGCVSMQSLHFRATDAALFGDEEARDLFIDCIQKAVVLAGQLGIGNIVIGSPKNRTIPDTMDQGLAFQIAEDVFGKLGDHASAHDTIIAIEPNPKIYNTNFINTIDDAMSFVRRMNHDSVRVNFDIGALHVNGQATLAGNLLRENLALVSHVHVSEPYLKPVPQAADVSGEILTDIRSTDYSKWVSIEMRATPEVPLQKVRHAIGFIQTVI